MAMYKVKITVYKGPTGKTLKGPTFVHFLGDMCLGFGVICALMVVLTVTDMEKYGVKVLIAGIVMTVVCFVLMVVLHKQARKSAEEAILKALANQEGQTTSKKPN